MKVLILGILLGLAIGYWRGYGDASRGRDNVVTRVLDKFGVEKVREAERTRERREREASEPRSSPDSTMNRPR